MDLDKLANVPISVEIGGKTLQFAEIPIVAHARLQRWIKDNFPNPLAAVREHLDEFEGDDRDRLLEAARRDALNWPPRVGSAEAASILLHDPDGQTELLWEALKVYQPESTRDEALRLRKAISRDESASRRIIAAIFGADPEEAADPSPKAAARRRRPTGRR